jgi:tetraacyldisaccharide-1-P 4'-kinase
MPQLKDAAYLVSGIAKPETIEKVVGEHVKIVKHKTFDDHHHYTHLEVEAMLDEASQLQARWIVTTAKDATKLAPFHSLRNRLWIIDMAVRFEGDLKAFYADIDRLARTRN